MNVVQNLVCVVLPVYKSVLNTFDRISVQRCFEILKHYEIILVCPAELDVKEYQSIADETGAKVQVIRKASFYFSGIDGYNRLLLSKHFYLEFQSFKYILIYQTDCYVFTDALTQWCSRGYDYIGAPWLKTNIYKWFTVDGLYPEELRMAHRFFKNMRISKVGNGGFSLRKTSAFIENLDRFEAVATNWKAYEDSFFSHYVKTFNTSFKIPDVTTALAFSFDANPEIAFKSNKNQLPFGCHAWCRTDHPHYTGNLGFWDPHISLNKQK